MLRAFLKRMWSPARDTPPTEAEKDRARYIELRRLREDHQMSDAARAEIDAEIREINRRDAERGRYSNG